MSFALSRGEDIPRHDVVDPSVQPTMSYHRVKLEPVDSRILIRSRSRLFISGPSCNSFARHSSSPGLINHHRRQYLSMTIRLPTLRTACSRLRAFGGLEIYDCSLRTFPAHSRSDGLIVAETTIYSLARWFISRLESPGELSTPPSALQTWPLVGRRRPPLDDRIAETR